MTGVNDIRKTFLKFFEGKGHEIVPSSSLVPLNDPTLMFTNAGMVPFKNVFTGVEKRDYKRATSSQKCVRAGGKHNDLDNVGFTARHHTFFEMLGNFSFGDYFKEEAISNAWELITKDFALDKKKLLVTVYSEDEEAAELWKKIAGLSDEKIIRISTSDNFWSMGDTGPCGPCSEIFFDHGDHIPGGPPGSPDEDGDRFIEIWNLVFMQYEQTEKERLDLPRPSIDTGMGLERIAAVLQGTHDNYETDLFKNLIAASVDILGCDDKGERKASHRVIADHLRASSFLIADGVLPSNEGRGYVLRRIMRRAMRHAELLGAREPLMYKLLPALIREMGQAYPDLVRGESLISETLHLEEQRFRKTLERGLKLLDEESADLKSGDALEGGVAFKLYDTYGFPLDLTEDALKTRGITVEKKGFDEAMALQKAEAKKNWKGSGDTADDSVWFGLQDELGATEFLGYSHEEGEGGLVAIVKDGKVVTSLKKGEEASLLFNQTPFYAESGGQVGDKGHIVFADGSEFVVSDTLKKLGNLFVHMGTLEKGAIKVGQSAVLTVDGTRRTAIRSNHSATHLLHEALRETLGDHVAQKGSLVDDGRLRFDFSHTKPMDEEEIKRVENLANEIVLQNAPVETRLMAVDDAIEAGAMALFGEKYGEEVRVVSMGTAVHGEKAGKVYSLELCGGTHVNRTGDIGLVHVVNESAVASGVRRLEALTGEAARAFLAGQDQMVKDASAALKVPPVQLVDRLESLVAERRKLENQVSDLKKQMAMGGSGGETEAIEEISGVSFMGKVIDDLPAKELRSLVDQGKQTVKSGIVVIIGKSEGKAGISVGVTDDLTDKFSAVDLVRIGSEALGGKGGGGRPDMAQAGGPDAGKADHALEQIKKAI
ncbi:MAG: alanine--tRNA ligase [Methyloligella sp.]|nr:MAG: alanine--tRNA ligase [Methyloligella sp.]